MNVLNNILLGLQIFSSVFPTVFNLIKNHGVPPAAVSQAINAQLTQAGATNAHMDAAQVAIQSATAAATATA